MATARARKGDTRPLSATEQRWLLDQLHRTATPTPAATSAAVGSEEASSMIVRPSPETPGRPAAPATGTAPGEAASIAAILPTPPGPGVPATIAAAPPPGTPPAVVPPAVEAEPTTAPVLPNRIGKRTGAHGAATRRAPRLAERPAPAAPAAPETGPMIPQLSAEGAVTTAAPVDLTRYRAVFACCCGVEQARDTPTEQSPSG